MGSAGSMWQAAAIACAAPARKARWVMDRSPLAGRIVAGLGAMVEWFALALQLGNAIRGATERGLTTVDALVVFFGFFTVLTSLLTAVILSAAVLRGESEGFLALPWVRAADVVYLAVMALIYNLLLRDLWAPTGARLFAEILMHDVMPALYIFQWVFFVPKGTLRWSDPVRFLAYPLAYFIYVLARGALIGRYPYPFLDLATLGYERLAVNALVLLCVFLVLGLVCVAADHLLARGGIGAARAPMPAFPDAGADRPPG